MIERPLTLPCGQTLPNRLCKAAMTEGLATAAGVPTPELQRLYGLWGDGGAGLLLTGNVMIDAAHLERPGNVVLASEPDPQTLGALTAWAAAATRNGNHCWVQISHAGRQTPKLVNRHPKAPSAVQVGLPGRQFGRPVAMSSEDIQAVIAGFSRCARVVKSAGFTGVQLHAAHGYLLSQFLSPRTNQRADPYGGSLENRARLLLECFHAVRAEVGTAFPVGVKLNSADFLRGGFDFTESLQVAKWLEDAGCDLLEVSGGTYEQPKLVGIPGIEPIEAQRVAESTRAREAYFVDFAQAMREQLTMPLMVTGGLRRRDVMEDVLASGSADVIGLARPLCVRPEGPRQLLEGSIAELPRLEDGLSLLPRQLRFLDAIPLIRTLSGFAVMYWYYEQLRQMGTAGQPDFNLSVFTAMRRQITLARRLATAMKPK